MNVLNFIKSTPLSVLIVTSLMSSPVLATSDNLQTIALQSHSLLQQTDMIETNTVELMTLFKASNSQNNKAIKVATSSCPQQGQNAQRRCDLISQSKKPKKPKKPKK